MADEPELAGYFALRTGGIDTSGARKAVFAAADQSGTALVDWFRAGDKLFVIVDRGNDKPDMRWLELGPERVSELASVYLAPETAATTLRRDPQLLQIFDSLIAPLAELTDPGEHLILCPTAPLHGIPLHALGIGGMPLLQRNPISYTPSLSVLHHCLVRGNNPAIRRKIALFGNPGGDTPGSEALLRDLADRFKVPLALGDAVTRPAVLAALRDAAIVHFQGHARHDPTDPMESRLHLSDGAITARYLFEQVGIAAGLIVLCACETGTSAVRDADDPVGLIPGFLVGGARRLLATSWRVSDKTSPALMREFYDRLPESGAANLAHILREAALNLRDSGHPEPYHWAPFVLYGDWRWKDVK